MMRKLLAAAVIAALLFALAACAVEAKAVELSADVSAQEIEPAALLPEQTEAVCAFSLRLMNGCYSGGNTMISPISLLSALGMTANGAAGETLAQMELVFGLPVDELNGYLYSWFATLPQNNGLSSSTGKLEMANSLWLREGVSVRQEFLQTNADYYGAQVYTAPFDSATAGEINRWVSAHTDGMIDEMIDKVSDDAMLYLLDAIAFDAQWQTQYQDDQVRDGTFTLEDGTEQTVSMMHSDESYYLETDLACGFLKPYSMKRYAFAALLPDEGVTVAELLESLTGEALYEALSQPTECRVVAATPKFSYAYNADMIEVLRECGMTDAFDASAADFSALSRSSDLCVSRVLHKTYIAVDERGTRAYAATAVELEATGTPVLEEYKTVILDRPFVYLIIDMKYSVPIFIGALMDPSGAGS